jgi:hypothetical protein
MSASGDLKEALKRMHKMLPFSDREAEIVCSAIELSPASGDLFSEEERQWFGSEAIEVARKCGYLEDG